MTTLRNAVAVLALTSLACSSSLTPRSGTTLQVTNGTCLLGHCDSLEVLAFPSNQPQTPGGYWSVDLGLLTTRQQCFTIPPSAVFRVIGVNPGGKSDTTTFTWTTADALSLGVQSPAGYRTMASPSTVTFVPSAATGWSITLPAQTHVTTSGPCAAG